MTSPTAKVPEQALTNSEELVRLILDSAAEAIFGCDPEGTCLFCNRAAVRLLGYDDPAELLGKNMHLLEHHSARSRAWPHSGCAEADWRSYRGTEGGGENSECESQYASPQNKQTRNQALPRRI